MSDHAPVAHHPKFAARLKRRYAAERRFRLLGLSAVLFSVLMLAVLLVSMTSNAIGGFRRVETSVPIILADSGMKVDAATLALPDAQRVLESAGLKPIVEAAAQQYLGDAGAAQLDQGAWREVARHCCSRKASTPACRSATTSPPPPRARASRSSAFWRLNFPARGRSPTASTSAFSPAAIPQTRRT